MPIKIVAVPDPGHQVDPGIRGLFENAGKYGGKQDEQPVATTHSDPTSGESFRPLQRPGKPLPSEPPQCPTVVFDNPSDNRFGDFRGDLDRAIDGSDGHTQILTNG